MADLGAFLSRIQVDYPFWLEYRKDPAAVLAGFDISDEDKRRLLAGDPALKAAVESAGLSVPPSVVGQRVSLLPMDEGDEGGGSDAPTLPPPPSNLSPPPPLPTSVPPIGLPPPPPPSPPPSHLIPPTFPTVTIWPVPIHLHKLSIPVGEEDLASLVDAVRASAGADRHAALLRLMENL